jgi:rhomboid protease GluP
MELDLVLRWLVGLSAVTGLAQTVRVHTRRLAPVAGWIGVFGLIVVVLGAGLLAWPELAGRVAAVPWLALVVVPGLGRQAVSRLVMSQRYAAASRISRAIAALHPFDGWLDDPVLYSGLAALQRGDLPGAARLASRGGDRGRRLLELQVLRARGAWPELHDRLLAAQAAGRGLDVDSALLWVRTLGEVGAPEAMLEAYRRLEPVPLSPSTLWSLRNTVAGLAGAVDLVERMMAVRGEAPPMLGEFWRATALQVAGRADEARALFEGMSGARDQLLARAARRRLEAPLPSVGELSPAGRAALGALVAATDDELRHGGGARAGRRRAYATLVLIGINLGAFALELPGGAEDETNLYNLGALVVPLSDPRADAWRILTAGFLHFGPLHLLMNLVGLWILGRYVEQRFGRVVLLIAYFVATFGGNALGAVLLALYRQGPELALGASGGVMGLLGAAMGMTLVAAVRHRSHLLGRELAGFASVLVLQTAFDITTPQVAFSIHASGFALGLVVGLVAGLGRRQPTVAPEV